MQYNGFHLLGRKSLRHPSLFQQKAAINNGSVTVMAVSFRPRLCVLAFQQGCSVHREIHL